jgi:hypothetical protein
MINDLIGQNKRSLIEINSSCFKLVSFYAAQINCIIEIEQKKERGKLFQLVNLIKK